MNLSIEKLEIIKKKSFQEGYDKGYKIGFEKGYEQGVDYSDSCLVARIEELEEECDQKTKSKQVEDSEYEAELLIKTYVNLGLTEEQAKHIIEVAKKDLDDN